MSLATNFAPDLSTARPAKRAKAASRPRVEPAKAMKKGSWYVSPEALKRLAIHATMEDKSQSELVNELLLSLNRFNMPGVNTRASRAPADDHSSTEEVSVE